MHRGRLQKSLTGVTASPRGVLLVGLPRVGEEIVPTLIGVAPLIHRQQYLLAASVWSPAPPAQAMGGKPLRRFTPAVLPMTVRWPRVALNLGTDELIGTVATPFTFRQLGSPPPRPTP